MTKSAAKVQKGVWSLKALRLMTTRPVCLMVKQYTEQRANVVPEQETQGLHV